MQDEKKNLNVDKRYFLNFDRVRGNIVYRLINTERNRKQLEDIPHMEFLDLSIVFNCLVSLEEHKSASLLVHNLHLKLWDVTLEKLYQTAKENTQRIDGYEIKSMAEVMSDIIKKEHPDGFNYDGCMAEFSDGIPMYVLSNKNRIGGAACMLYTGLLRDFAEELSDSFYIIPSSVHEVLLLPVGNLDMSSEIKCLIKEINGTEVKSEDILSDSLYYYDKECDKICIC